MKIYTPLCLLLAMTMLLATPAVAHELHGDSDTGEEHTRQVDDDRAFDDFIRAIDVVAPREQLERRWPDVLDRLVDRATDSEATTFERRRALSMLGMFPEPSAQQALMELTAESDERLRSLAFYTLGRFFVDRDDDRLLAHLETGLRDPSLSVRADVVRSLGWTPHPRARTLLSEVINNADDETLVQEAHRSLERLGRD